MSGPPLDISERLSENTAALSLSSSSSSPRSTDQTGNGSTYQSTAPLPLSRDTAPVPNDPAPYVNTIGSGGGGPPGHLSSPHLGSARLATGGPPPRMGGGGPSSRINSGGPPEGATGGPRSRAQAIDMTKQAASPKIPPYLQARIAAASANRGASTSSKTPSPAIPVENGQSVPNEPAAPDQAGAGGAGAFRVPEGLRPAPGLPPGARGPGSGGGLAARRKGPGLKLSDAAGGPDPSRSEMSAPARAPNGSVGSSARRLAPPGKLSAAGPGIMSNAFDMHKNIVDPSGRLRFDGKAVLSASGVEFRNGTSFQINMEDLDLLNELGKGAYGTVRKVRHTKTRVEMAMKEIRLELDDSKLNAIIMELDILHRATAPEIVEFYGAFFYESCVYYCMEFMDAGSLENLYCGKCSVPEDVLARIVGCMVRGLRFLKDSLQIMHRDVKPTNVLLNRKGEVKLCDFGVSGQLEKSLAKTNIGCQSYMAPERIKGESQNLVGTYTVASDVWSLGLSIVETTLGTYPYPPETYSNVFAQLQAIVHGDPPQIPGECYSDTARDFVAGCLEKVPEKRSTYKQMLEHPWLLADSQRGAEGVDMAGWVAMAYERKAKKKQEERTEVKLG